MKRIYLILLFVILTSVLLAEYELRFSPPSLTVNRFNTFDLDPVNPANQPKYCDLIITNKGESQRFELEVQIYWNNTVLIGENSILLASIAPLASNVSVVLSNQELITNSGGMYFNAQNNVDIISAVKNVPKLEQALMAGYYPDGMLQFRVRIRPLNSRGWQEPPAVFGINIKNSSAIHLIGPGLRINQVAPKLSSLSLQFNWYSFVPEFNEEILVLKEFPPSQPPRSENVEITGKEVFRMAGVSSGFNEYLPLNDGCYYAWQVYSPQYTGSSPLVRGRDTANGARISSPWYVFQYVKDEREEQWANEMNVLLRNMNRPLILNLLLSGYASGGELELDGRIYKGQDALNVIEALAGKSIQVEIVD